MTNLLKLDLFEDEDITGTEEEKIKLVKWVSDSFHGEDSYRYFTPMNLKGEEKDLLISYISKEYFPEWVSELDEDMQELRIYLHEKTGKWFVRSDT